MKRLALRAIAARGIVVAFVACVGLAPTARAGSIVLGDSGWEAVWDASQDPFVSIAVDLVTPDAVFIQQTAEFQGLPGPGGFPSIPVVFRQIAVPATSQIVINDEVITNSTGAAWSGFTFQLFDHGDAVFNPALTNGSNGGVGFSTAPLVNQTFSSDLTTLTVDGIGAGPASVGDAVVPAGGVFFPGVASGELYIDLAPATEAPFTVFTLKQTPTPEPTACLLVLIGAAAVIRRKR